MSAISFLSPRMRNGALITDAEQTAVWLVFDGFRHIYPSLALYNRIHVPVELDRYVDIESIPEGPAMGADAELITDSNTIFLLNNGIKRPFLSDELFNQYRCKSANVHAYTPGVIHAIPSGPPMPG